MDSRTAKEFLHIKEWCERCAAIVGSGREAYLSNPILQEAGDSLLMKIGEAARRLSQLGAAEPPNVRWADAIANRNWLIHQYDHIDRTLTWNTLAQEVPLWVNALTSEFRTAELLLGQQGDTHAPRSSDPRFPGHRA